MDGSRPPRDTQKRVKSIVYLFPVPKKKKHPSFIMVRDFDDIHQHINFSKVKILAIRPCRTLHH